MKVLEGNENKAAANLINTCLIAMNIDNTRQGPWKSRPTGCHETNDNGNKIVNNRDTN